MEYREITGKKLSKDEIALRKKVRKEIEDISAKTDLAGKKIYAMGGLPNADILDDIIYDYQSKTQTYTETDVVYPAGSIFYKNYDGEITPVDYDKNRS